MAKGKKNGIYGFLIEALDPDVMKSYITENDLSGSLPTDIEDATPQQLAVTLSAHFQEKAKKGKGDDDLVKCEKCEGISTVDCDTCPFCGDAGGVEDETTASEDAEEEDEESEDEDESEDEESEDEEEDEDEDEDEGRAGAPRAEAEETADADDSADEEEEPDPKPAKKVAVKKKAAAKKTAADKKEKTNMGAAGAVNGVSTSKKSTALAKGAAAEVISAKDLDKAVADLQKLKGNAAESYWELGKKLLEINEKQLWKLRVDEKGKAKYKGFDAFVFAECGMSVQHAYNAIEVAKNYDDPKEVRELGTTKALLLLKAAPEDRPKLKEKAKAGATTREIKKDAQKSRALKGSGKKSQQAKAGAKGAASTAKKKAAVADKVSIANIEGSKTIKLFKRPDSLRGLDWAQLARAKKLADVPFGKHELANGVVQYFSVLEKDGELVLKIETRRQTEE